MKRVEVIVLNWNGWVDTLACLTTLQRLDYSNFGLIVVDNGSTDNSVTEIRAHYPDITLLQTGANLGFGGGCNLGMRHALACGVDYVWLINSDATVAPDALSALVAKAEACPEVGAVGSVLFDVACPDRAQLWGGGRVSLWRGRSHHQRSAATLDFVSGASVLLRRTALEQVGLFDAQAFFMYWEDTDLGFRLRQAGWQLAVAKESKVWHKQSASLGPRSPLLDEYFTCSAVRFLRKYAPLPAVSTALLLGMLLGTRLLRGELARAGAVMRGFANA